jgi:hypothetical protein
MTVYSETVKKKIEGLKKELQEVEQERDEVLVELRNAYRKLRVIRSHAQEGMDSISGR